MKFNVGDRVRIVKCGSPFGAHEHVGCEGIFRGIEVHSSTNEPDIYRVYLTNRSGSLCTAEEIELVEPLVDMSEYVKKEDVWNQLVEYFGSNFHLKEPGVVRSLAEVGITPPKPKMKRIRIEFDIAEGDAKLIPAPTRADTLYGLPIENYSITEVDG